MDVPAVPAAAGTTGVTQLPVWMLAALLALTATVVWLVAFDNGQASGVRDSTGTYLRLICVIA